MNNEPTIEEIRENEYFCEFCGNNLFETRRINSGRDVYYLCTCDECGDEIEIYE